MLLLPAWTETYADFAIPEYIERQKSCCRRAEKFCRISEFGVDAALRRRGAAYPQ